MDPHKIVKCKDCGLVYVNPRLKEEALKDIYNESYGDTYIKQESTRSSQAEEDFDDVSKHCHFNGNKLLDIGCSAGFFLKAAKERGWQCRGIDLDKEAVEFAKKKFDLDVEYRALEETDFKEKEFDLITLWGVLAHLRDPKAYFIYINRILKDDGWLVLSSLNIDSICARLFKERFRLIDPSAHIYYFSTTTITKLLELTGFEVKRRYYPFWSTPYFKWIELWNVPLRLFHLKVYNPILKFLGLENFVKKDIKSPPFWGNMVVVYARKKLT
ncbi:MAG: class I SAM-dependent methyltransferase [Candidatus Omnitrophica bacterium]|nr:class I SAM-dependent methyltransferase [Candidatus Omnitrophota bacterium]